MNDERLPEIDYLMLAAVCNRPRIEANKELVKYLMKRQLDNQFKLSSIKPRFVYDDQQD